MARKWLDLLRSLGEALVEVLNAEVAALKADISTSGRRLAAALALVAWAAFLLFWAIGAAGLVLFHVAALWLADWVSALIVFVLFLTVGLAIGWVARRRLSVIESPAATVRRRVEDHLQWWEERLVSDAHGEIPGELPASGEKTEGAPEAES